MCSPDHPTSSDSPGLALVGVAVLIVDDDPAGARMMAAVVRGEGCEVRAVGSAEEALAVLKVFRARVVVLDIDLPGMDGLLLARTLKADPATKDLILAAVTAFDEPAVERAALSAGCARYVPKPIDPVEFARWLRDHVSAEDVRKRA